MLQRVECEYLGSEPSWYSYAREMFCIRKCFHVRDEDAKPCSRSHDQRTSVGCGDPPTLPRDHMCDVILTSHIWLKPAQLVAGGAGGP